MKTQKCQKCRKTYFRQCLVECHQNLMTKRKISIRFSFAIIFATNTCRNPLLCLLAIGKDCVYFLRFFLDVSGACIFRTQNNVFFCNIFFAIIFVVAKSCDHCLGWHCNPAYNDTACPIHVVFLLCFVLFSKRWVGHRKPVRVPNTCSTFVS